MVLLLLKMVDPGWSRVRILGIHQMFLYSILGSLLCILLLLESSPSSGSAIMAPSLGMGVSADESHELSDDYHRKSHKYHHKSYHKHKGNRTTKVLIILKFRSVCASSPRKSSSPLSPSPSQAQSWTCTQTQARYVYSVSSNSMNRLEPIHFAGHGHGHKHKHGHSHSHKHGHGHKHGHNHKHGHDQLVFGRQWKLSIDWCFLSSATITMVISTAIITPTVTSMVMITKVRIPLNNPHLWTNFWI